MSIAAETEIKTTVAKNGKWLPEEVSGGCKMKNLNRSRADLFELKFQRTKGEIRKFYQCKVIQENNVGKDSEKKLEWPG